MLNRDDARIQTIMATSKGSSRVVDNVWTFICNVATCTNSSSIKPHNPYAGLTKSRSHPSKLVYEGLPSEVHQCLCPSSTFAKEIGLSVELGHKHGHSSFSAVKQIDRILNPPYRYHTLPLSIRPIKCL
eukprot:c21078_g1_i1 orf=598-984(-)